MAIRLTTNAQIDRFIANVITAAHHHGPNVETVVQPLSDAVRRRLNLGVDKIEVYQRLGNIARTCWVTIGGARYAFSYNHAAGQIEMRERTLQGRVLASFNNGTSIRQIARNVAQM
jgi:hypothetical protein